LNDDYYGKVFERIPEKKEAIIENFALLVQAFVDYEKKSMLKLSVTAPSATRNRRASNEQ
jgi:hypothetical protein